VGDPAGGDQIDPGGGDRRRGLGGDAARGLSDGAPPDHRDGAAQGRRVHVVEQHGVDAVFESLGKHARKDAILASNSSTIAISRLADFTGRPDRCCNMHFFHPVTVMQLCEVVRGPKTSDATVAAAMDFVRSIDRTPVLLQKEIWGFIVNRILFAASEEAIRLLEGGYASADDIDVAVQKGLNWPMGPFHLLDFSGLDIFYGAMKDRHRQGEGDEAPELLRKLVEEGHLGRKTRKGFFEYPK